MKYIGKTGLAILSSLVACQLWSAESSIIAPGATVQKLSGDFQFTEGPAADAEGNVYFTDQPNDQIVKYTVDGKFETFMKPCGRANGMFFAPQGLLIACADEKNELWAIDVKTKQRTVWVKDYQGRLLNGPNDVWVRPDGGLYFTDPFYVRKWWSRGEKPQMEQDGQHVYYLSADRKTLKRVITDFMQPNGIKGTPDGRALYVADIKAKKTHRYDIQPDGSLANKQLFCELGSDGMTMDVEGNLYLTGKGVTVFDKSGKQIEQIAVPEGWTANVTFGGRNRDLLFMTAKTSVYGLKMRVKGAY